MEGKRWSVDIDRTIAIIPAEKQSKYRNIFHYIDKDGSGALSLEEIEDYFLSAAYLSANSSDAPPKDIDILRAFEEIDVNEDGELSINEFLAFMLRLPRKEVHWEGFDDEDPCVHPDEGVVKRLSFREKVWETFEKPSSSILAKVIALTMMILIFISVSCFCIESMLSIKKLIKDHDIKIFVYTESVCVIAFTAEYVIRLWASPKPWQFIFELLNIIDLVAILPFYVELAVGSNNANVDESINTISGIDDSTAESSSSGAVIRVVRLVRIFRMAKFGRYLEGLQMMSNALKKSAVPLGMAVFVTMISVVLFLPSFFLQKRGRYGMQTVKFG